MSDRLREALEAERVMGNVTERAYERLLAVHTAVLATPAPTDDGHDCGEAVRDALTTLRAAVEGLLRDWEVAMASGEPVRDRDALALSVMALDDALATPAPTEDRSESAYWRGHSDGLNAALGQMTVHPAPTEDPNMTEPIAYPHGHTNPPAPTEDVG